MSDHAPDWKMLQEAIEDARALVEELARCDRLVRHTVALEARLTKLARLHTEIEAVISSLRLAGGAPVKEQVGTLERAASELQEATRPVQNEPLGEVFEDLRARAERAAVRLRRLQDALRSEQESALRVSPDTMPQDQRPALHRLRSELAALPVRNPDDGFSGRNHDEALYGGP